LTEGEHLSVIVVRAAMDRDWMEHLLAAGASGAISKSTHPVSLATLPRETLSGHIFHKFVGGRKIRSKGNSITTDALPLTGRAIEILRLVAAGAPNGDVARKLWVTEQTVKCHLRNMYRTLDVTNRAGRATSLMSTDS
jgi:DNA-binding NarL/FixJ family response regulator